MALLEIKKYPEKVLKEKAALIEDIDKGVLRLIDDMTETMYSASGVGLAAPQVGISKRVIVVDVCLNAEKTPLIVLINPEIKQAEGETEGQEGCLSLPDFATNITRHEKVVVSGYDRKGKLIEIQGEGLLARALQHEIDHLDGILLLDRTNSAKREFFKKKIKKAALARV